MIIKGYGVTLQTMTSADAEQIRLWRNSASLNRVMYNTRIISAEEQQQWYSSLDLTKNAHFMVVYDHLSIGFCSLKNINQDDHSAEVGVFIALEEYQNSTIGLSMLFCLMDFGYLQFGLTHYYGHVLKQNPNAIAVYKSIGAVLEEHPDQVLITMRLRNYDQPNHVQARANALLRKYLRWTEQIAIVQ